MISETAYSDVKQKETYSPRNESAPSAKDNEEVSLFDLAVVLLEQRRTILWVAVSFCVLSAILSLLLPKRYTAVVTLLPPQQNISISSAIASQLGNLGGMAALAGGS